MTTLARSGAAAIAAVLTLTLAACSGGATPTTSAGTTSAGTTSAQAPMMMSSGPTGSAASAEHNAADVMFAQMMIPHHQDAIVMADLAPGRAENAQVKDLAGRIKAAQAPEIEEMTSWLADWDIPAMMTSAAMGGMDVGGMDHGGSDDSATSAMPGMMSADEMAELTAASGAEFDRLFLELMIVHHQGAIEMADTEIANGGYPATVDLAESIKSSQTTEIAEMQRLLQNM